MNIFQALPEEKCFKTFAFLALLFDDKKNQTDLNLLTHRKNLIENKNLINQEETFLPFYASKNFE